MKIHLQLLTQELYELWICFLDNSPVTWSLTTIFSALT